MCLNHPWLIVFKKLLSSERSLFEKWVNHVFKPGRSCV